MQKIKIGDVVKYRDWKDGDIPKDEIPVHSQCWGLVGLVVKICKSRFKLETEECAVEIMDNNGDIHLARAKDVDVLAGRYLIQNASG